MPTVPIITPPSVWWMLIKFDPSKTSRIILIIPPAPTPNMILRVFFSFLGVCWFHGICKTLPVLTAAIICSAFSNRSRFYLSLFQRAWISVANCLKLKATWSHSVSTGIFSTWWGSEIADLFARKPRKTNESMITKRIKLIKIKFSKVVESGVIHPASLPSIVIKNTITSEIVLMQQNGTFSFLPGCSVGFAMTPYSTCMRFLDWYVIGLDRSVY